MRRLVDVNLMGTLYAARAALARDALAGTAATSSRSRRSRADAASGDPASTRRRRPRRSASSKALRAEFAGTTLRASVIYPVSTDHRISRRDRARLRPHGEGQRTEAVGRPGRTGYRGVHGAPARRGVPVREREVARRAERRGAGAGGQVRAALRPTHSASHRIGGTRWRLRHRTRSWRARANWRWRSSRAGGRALIVGGWVRDELLGRRSKDLDLEVFGLPADRLRPLLETFGRVDTVGESFTVYKLGAIDVSLPRRESKIGRGHKGFAVEGDPTLSSTEAARRRDFTDERDVARSDHRRADRSIRRPATISFTGGFEWWTAGRSATTACACSAACSSPPGSI